MRLKMSFVFLFVSAMFLVSFPSPAQASSQQETLDQYISDLQKNPGDNSFREKIIKLAQEMKPVPALPEEAQKHLDRGVAAIEGAKSEEDFKDSITEFTQVVNSAPWFGGGYRPLAIAQDKAGQYDAALKNLEFYLLSQPSAEDAAWAKSMMNKIEYRKEKAAKESSPEALAQKQQDKTEAFLKSLNGSRFVFYIPDPECYNLERLVNIQGDDLVVTDEATQVFKRNCTPSNMFPGAPLETFRLNFREFNKTMRGDDLILELPSPNAIYKSVTISGDGNRVTLNYGGGITNVCVRK